MSLKKLTQSKHSGAERSWIAGLMMSGKITNEQYSIYLKQQFESYTALENRFNNLDPNSGVEFPDERIKRSENIHKDLLEMDSEGDSLPVLDSTL